jgi:uncharacterized protein (DUF736 family)
MNNEISINIIMTPHTWDNANNPYFWCIFKNNGNIGCGWSKTPKDAWEDANKYYKEMQKNGDSRLLHNKEEES